ncbi:Type 1 glutamine amidotransferase-like domain-containing protein [Candidatus Parcubacteria bacterium]|nr:Type 1 glutamine amidotransferase-like domain-containing protein [Candidatus Parcubacteria bacterium]
MKNLLLSSSGTFITRFDIKEFKKPLKDMKMAYITTASKKVEDSTYVVNRKKEMDKQGFDYEEIDIGGKTENELRKNLKDKKIIYVEGGNAFYLLKCVRESRFEKIVKELIKKGVIYIGSSAGSYIACPTIEIADKASGHNFNKCGITNYTAMNLVPFLIKAHYNPDEKEELKEKLKNVKYPIRPLTDDQAILVKNNKVSLLENGKEIIF